MFNVKRSAKETVIASHSQGTEVSWGPLEVAAKPQAKKHFPIVIVKSKYST